MFPLNQRRYRPKRGRSIEALLSVSKKHMALLENEYNASIRDNDVRDELKVTIKNIFENLRSVFDYIARDVFESCCPGATMPDRLYFPVSDNDKKYEDKVRRDFPGLIESHPRIYELMKGIQDTKAQWWDAFSQATNANKHDDLLDQIRIERYQVTVTDSSGRSASWTSGAQFIGHVEVLGVRIDPKTQRPEANDRVTTTEVPHVDFRFSGIDENVLDFTGRSIKLTEEFYRKMVRELSSPQ